MSQPVLQRKVFFTSLINSSIVGSQGRSIVNRGKNQRLLSIATYHIPVLSLQRMAWLNGQAIIVYRLTVGLVGNSHNIGAIGQKLAVERLFLGSLCSLYGSIALCNAIHIRCRTSLGCYIEDAFLDIALGSLGIEVDINGQHTVLCREGGEVERFGINSTLAGIFCCKLVNARTLSFQFEISLAVCLHNRSKVFQSCITIQYHRRLIRDIPV